MTDKPAYNDSRTELRNAAGVERVLPGATRIGPAHGHPGGPRKETEGQRMREADRKENRFDAGFLASGGFAHCIIGFSCFF